jgi:hypothetical protein
MVEAEFAVLANQCIGDRRIGEEETLKSETAAWERERNKRKAYGTVAIYGGRRSRETQATLPLINIVVYY